MIPFFLNINTYLWRGRFHLLYQEDPPWLCCALESYCVEIESFPLKALKDLYLERKGQDHHHWTTKRLLVKEKCSRHVMLKKGKKMIFLWGRVVACCLLWKNVQEEPHGRRICYIKEVICIQIMFEEFCEGKFGVCLQELFFNSRRKNDLGGKKLTVEALWRNAWTWVED